MNRLKTIWLKLRSLWQRREVKREIDEELRFHLEQRTAENLAAGMGPEEAAREARKRFGNLQSVREECRETRGASLGEGAWRDLRFAFRMLWKNPGFTTVAMATLGLGIGATTATFGLLDSARNCVPPGTEVSGVVLLRLDHAGAKGRRVDFSLPDLQDYRQQQSAFVDFAGTAQNTVIVTDDMAAPARCSGVRCVGPFGTLMGVKPVVGRWWNEQEEAERVPVAVISDRLWQSRFGGRADVLGRTLRLDGKPAVIIGVAPMGFDFPDAADLWWPLLATDKESGRGNRYLVTVGRLRPEGSLAVANQQLSAIAARLAADYPESNQGFTVSTVRLSDYLVEGEVRQLLQVAAATVALVWLIACVNVTNLLLARGAARAKEIAVREALGAGRGQVVRLLMMESLLLAVGGAVIGLPLAWGLGGVFEWQRAAMNAPSWLYCAVNLRVAVFLVACIAVTCLVAGLAPALRLGRSDLATLLNAGGRTATSARFGRFMRGFVAAEIGLCAVLLVGTGLLIRTVAAARNADLGYQPESIYTCRISLPETVYPGEAGQSRFAEDWTARMRGRPEVAAVAVSSQRMTATGTGELILEGSASGDGRQTMWAGIGCVGPDWFNTLGVGLKQGRLFDSGDRAGMEPVAIVNGAFVREYWPASDGLGRRFKIANARNATAQPWITVVGVVSDFYQGDFTGPISPRIYVPFAQRPTRTFSAYVRLKASAAASAAEIVRQETRALDASLPVYFGRPLPQELERVLLLKRILAWVMTGFGGVALLLAGIGLFGVMSYLVGLRTREIGVRVALGARRGDVVGLVLRQAARQIALGLALGFIVAGCTMRCLGPMLYGVDPWDPLTYAAVVAILAGVGILAVLIPVARAMGVNPVEALRCE